MSKKVLIISSSPRKYGNTDTLCNEFMRGALEKGHYAEIIMLRNKKINYCTGCGTCGSTHRCVQRDDMPALLEKMIAADVIVLASPVYFYSVSAQLKTMIDRVNARYNEIVGKEFYFILTASDDEEDNLNRAVEALRGFLCCVESPIECGVIKAAGVWGKGEVKNTPYMKKAYEMGRNI